ncbi:hypothetical protein CJ030_MR4G008619 [Morella rubra]|uniref:Uncharacterized protein n=1 Tax=Morella rubra TaxID=262757 RepID=A0A6A1W1G9_9ROSI|nr:hypothetical protein CJ030_MR4G008619 [Morella rubra]
MTVGGKRLHCDSSARSVGASNHPRTRSAATPPNVVDNNLPSPESSTRIAPRRVVVRDDFNLDYDRPEDCNTVMSTMNIAYMTHRNRMHQAKLTVAHTSGARSFHHALVLMKDLETDQINPVLMYKKMHTNKDGVWTSDTAWEHFEKMEALQL